MGEVAIIACLIRLQAAPTIDIRKDEHWVDTDYNVPLSGQSDLVTGIFIQHHRH